VDRVEHFELFSWSTRTKVHAPWLTQSAERSAMRLFAIEFAVGSG
jgi:hypothetical protein